MTPAAAAERFRLLRERATAKLATARSDAATLRARVQRESAELTAGEDDEPATKLVSPWPDQHRPARYAFDDTPDDTPAPAAEPAGGPDLGQGPAEPDQGPDLGVDPEPEDGDDENMSKVDSWLR